MSMNSQPPAVLGIKKNHVFMKPAFFKNQHRGKMKTYKINVS